MLRQGNESQMDISERSYYEEIYVRHKGSRSTTFKDAGRCTGYRLVSKNKTAIKLLTFCIIILSQPICILQVLHITLSSEHPDPRFHRQ